MPHRQSALHRLPRLQRPLSNTLYIIIFTFQVNTSIYFAMLAWYFFVCVEQRLIYGKGLGFYGEPFVSHITSDSPSLLYFACPRISE